MSSACRSGNAREAFLQRRLAESASLDVAFLPYRDAALEDLRRSVKEGARAVLVTTADPALARQVAGHLGIAEVESGSAPDPSAGKHAGLGWIPRALRPYQWLKNALVFLPFLLSHEVGVVSKWIAATLLFFGFSFCASASYVVNDILDRRQDRLHPRRCRRPIASGEAPLGQALWLPLPQWRLPRCPAFSCRPLARWPSPCTSRLRRSTPRSRRI